MKKTYLATVSTNTLVLSKTVSVRFVANGDRLRNAFADFACGEGGDLHVVVVVVVVVVDVTCSVFVAARSGSLRYSSLLHGN